VCVYVAHVRFSDIFYVCLLGLDGMAWQGFQLIVFFCFFLLGVKCAYVLGSAYVYKV